MSDSEDDLPLSARRGKPAAAETAAKEPKAAPMGPGAPAAAAAARNGRDEASADSDSDVPLAQRKKPAATAAGKDGPKKEAVKRPRSANRQSKKEADSESDSDVPLAKKMKKEVKPKAPAKKAQVNGATRDKKDEGNGKPVARPSSASRKRQKDEADSDDAADVKPEKKPRKKADGAAAPKGKGKAKKVSEGADEEAKEENEEEEFKWWLEQEREDDSVKWTTLEHNGPFFPPPYVPHGVKMKYDGKPVDLEPEAEEVATFFAGVVGTDWEKNPIFQENFFKDFLKILGKQKKPCPIKSFAKCDFSPIAEYLAQEKERKKGMSKEEKQKLKDEKAKLDLKYGWALLDGRKEKVGNYRIEPPGLFRGRGAHPKTGMLKTRVMPEQVTINIAEGVKVPEPPEGHKWADVVHENKVTWLAMWKENVNDSIKYVFLAPTSSLKGQSDMKKFEKARALKEHVHAIRRDYTRELKDKEMMKRQRATAMYFIDRLALRAGNEKGDDEADTVGCCSLRFEHVTLQLPNILVFDFLGKDSIRYHNAVAVDDQVFKNIKVFKKPPKKEGDDLFDRLNTSSLNKHLSSYMPGLTAKVFRTYNASYTFQEELKNTPADGTVAEKLLAYQRANRRVAKLCNHQRAVPKTHQQSLDKIRNKIYDLKIERKEIKEQMLELDPKLKKKRPELLEPESDLDDDIIATRKEENQQKRLLVENNKRAKEGLPPVTLEDLPSPKKNTPTIEKLDKKLELCLEKIQAQKMLMIDKDENKETALGTSKINYIDPRISAVWCKKFGVDIAKVFPKTLREKFKWAMDPPEDWQF